MMILYKNPKNRDMGPVCCLVWPYGCNDVMGHGRGGHKGRRGLIDGLAES